MLNETMLTLQGWVGGEVTLRHAGEAPVAGFRLAVTPRRFNRRSGEWGDGPTVWYSVNAWRGLADNVATSVRRGDPVVVHGRLTTSSWVNSAGVEVTSMEVDAVLVGHDLTRGTSSFARTPRPASSAAGAEEAAAGDGVAA
ncbi:single-stranded DNA-binding protein [Nocardioides sp. Leaf307]|uniref:single-stranded DNA-binding protein n=1 Tax=Nocardioides sp. Leaf307 TaxID=1736331 RepID=UPI000A41E552|nr:single-stranded DNA-binding protein [Nocardioides sp. Leaf307]